MHECCFLLRKKTTKIINIPAERLDANKEGWNEGNKDTREERKIKEGHKEGKVFLSDKLFHLLSR